MDSNNGRRRDDRVERVRGSARGCWGLWRVAVVWILCFSVGAGCSGRVYDRFGSVVCDTKFAFGVGEMRCAGLCYGNFNWRLHLTFDEH